MHSDRRADGAGAPWEAAAEELAGVLGDQPFELRCSLHGAGGAVRVLAPRGPVAPRHAEGPDVQAPWSVAARCGEAAGWLLAGRAPADPARALAVLQQATDRHVGLARERLARQEAALTYDLLEAEGAAIAIATDAEVAMANVPGPGWAGCARLLAEAIAGDPRLGGAQAELGIAAHPEGWLVIAGAPGAVGAEVPWTQQHLGRLVHGGQIISAAGGSVAARRTDGDGLRVSWAVPAAPSA
jgi:hypothetical protein